MASAPAVLRDTHALLDPPSQAVRGRSEGSSIASFHSVGARLLRAALHAGRREAAVAAAEVFREAARAFPIDPSLHNSLGASLLTLARFESHATARTLLSEAAEEFQMALATVEDRRAPRAARLRYLINLATAEWIQGERLGDHGLVRRAAGTFQAITSELSPSSAHWAHVQDNLGNALVALGQTTEAIQAFEAALSSAQSNLERARSLNNLGTAYAHTGNYAEARKFYQEALSLLFADEFPLVWGLTQHNLASVLLQSALSNGQLDQEGVGLKASVEAFRAALSVRLRSRTPLDWAITAVNMASALLSLGTHLCSAEIPAERHAGLGHIREAISLYRETLPELPDADLKKTVSNLHTALQILSKLSPGQEVQAEVQAHQKYLASFVVGPGVNAVTDKIAGLDKAAPGLLPGAWRWPTELYSQAHKERKENIVQFLTRVWLPLIEIGAVDLRTLRVRDPSAAKAIDNFRQRRDPVTGLRRTLPPPLDIPTKREVNDRLLASIAYAGDRPVRLDWAIRARARRNKMKENL